MNITGGDWINSSEDQCMNIISWNNWLKDNNFKYNVNIKRILEILQISIDRVERSDAAITLDPELIGIINADNSNNTDTEIESWINTVSRITGFFVIVYGMLLLGAWVIDVNIYGGIKLLTLLTLGKWVAVRSASDYPEISGTDKHYMDMFGIIKSLFVICLYILSD